MGWATRANAKNGLPRILSTRLSMLRAVVDVQHLYRTGRHAGDRGTIYTLKDGTHVAEAEAATIYATALVAWLRARGAAVLTNDPARGDLVGPYSLRNLLARSWIADCYLACHLNAGGGSYGLFEYMASVKSDALARSIGYQVTIDFADTIPGVRFKGLNHGDRGAVCIEGFPVASVILEPFFGDNPAHQVLFATPTLHQLGETIGEGVAQWWERRATVRAV